MPLAWQLASTSNQPPEDWGKLIGDVPAATAILDGFLHHAEIITIKGRSYRLKDRAEKSKEVVQSEREARGCRRASRSLADGAAGPNAKAACRKKYSAACGRNQMPNAKCSMTNLGLVQKR